MPHSRNKPLYLSQQASSRPGLLQGLSHLPKNSTSLLLSLKVILKLWLKLSTPMRTLYLHLAICSLRPNLPLLPIIVFPFLMYVDLVTFTATKCIFVDKIFFTKSPIFRCRDFWWQNLFFGYEIGLDTYTKSSKVLATKDFISKRSDYLKKNRDKNSLSPNVFFAKYII